MRGFRDLLIPALLAAMLVPATRATGAPSAPLVGTISTEALDRAREEARTAPPVEGHSWEDREQMQLDQDYFSSPLTLNSTDDDACHYARGSCMIVHIFIDHNPGSWTAEDRQTMAARSRTAKDHYLNNAPAGANLHFDHDGSEGYYFYSVDYNGTIPQDGMTSALMNTVTELIGFSDGDADGSAVDDFSLWLMNWNGGWDNVLLCYHPLVTGRAWASYGHAKCALYTDDSGNVFAHEWGHLFGACDEYVENNECNGGINCGACQSAYLDDVINNGNCQLANCPSDVSCIMINNTFNGICNYTLNHWGWVDEDNDGILDWTKRRTTGNNFVEIYVIPHGGYALWNNTTDGYVISQQWNTWSVAGLRPPSGSDYDLQMYGDFNHNYPLASSSYGGEAIDFVVSDYNHDRPGNEHLQANLYSGPANNYRLSWESGTGVIYSDGVERSSSWNAANVVRAYDVPLFGGETVTFTLDITSGSVDLGMALFKSNGDYYHVGRASAQWIRDAGGAGVTETYTYNVPSDDVYGLVLFANNAADADFTIQIGPTPFTLAEETPFNSGLDLRLFNYDPNAFYWSFTGTRPESGTNVTHRLFGDSDYGTELETSDNYAGLEFIAADYNPSYSTDYLRVVRDSGAGTHRTEWEHDGDLMTGAVNSQTWDSGHVGKVWDCYMEANKRYFWREYHAIGDDLDTGIYIFDSSDGDRWKQRNAYANAANFRPAADGGEWFSYQAPTTDYYGFYQIVNDESAGSYSIWFGADHDLAEEQQVRETNEITFAHANVPSGYWAVFASRPYFADNGSIWVYGDDGYTITTLKANQQDNARVPFIVSDFNHTPAGNYYPRYRRTSGNQGYDIEWEAGSEAFVYSGSTIVSDVTWTTHDVADIFDLYVPAGQTLKIKVEDLTPNNIDPGIALFRSNGAEYWATIGEAVASADANPTGGSEEISYTFPASDWYGLVVFSKDDVDSGGTYRITIYDPATVSVEDSDVRDFGIASASENPFHGNAAISFSLTREAHAELSIFDAQGRMVRTLYSDLATAGSHSVVWDGLDAQGTAAPAGLYFARLRSGEGERLLKLVRSR